ncbi:MAG: DUF342 domain-containing protein [Peptococcaceae bacterium]|nr:DUF342 domain-containing protein [Peptococcaceae bacterium]
MKEIIAKGKSLDELRKNWAKKWECLPEELEMAILEKPGFVNKNWTVRITLRNSFPEKFGETRIVWDGMKYLIFPGDEVETVVPFPMAGKLKYHDKELFEEFKISKDESLEFYPVVNNGEFSWEIKVDENGERAIAKVTQERPGRFVLNEELTWKKKWFLERNVYWEDLPWCIIKPETEQLFRNALKEHGIVSGILPDFWEKVLNVDGTEEILIAEYRLPVESIHAVLEDFETRVNNDDQIRDRIDYFASKIHILEKDELVARRIPGREGIPGKDIFGKDIPVQKMKDFQLKALKNTYITEDGLEVRAACAGAPIRLKNYTYAIEEVYLHNKDVDLSTGSIEFPGDVIISKDVLDGFHVFSGGRINIKGLVSGAKLKAEGGMSIGSNVFNSHIAVGEKHYLRSRFLKKLSEMEERLNQFLDQLDMIQKTAAKTNISFKQLFRTVLEKKYNDITIKARELSNLTQVEDEEFFTREIITAVHTVKYFVAGIGPFEIKDNTYLVASLREIHKFLLDKGTIVPENVTFVAGYVQNSDIKCSGDFVCRSDIYNSNVRVEGNIKIYGACRGSSLVSENKIFAHELGSSEGGGNTVVRIPSTGHLTAEYCHPNVKIFIGKEYVPIEQTVRKLDIYIEKGKLWVDKIKWLDTNTENNKL